MGSSEYRDGQVLPFSISAFWVSGAPGFDQRLHMRNVLARVPKGSAEMVAAAIRTIFAQPDAEAVAEQLASIAGNLGAVPGRRAVLIDAAPEITAFCAFPPSHWRRIWSTNPLERVNGEIKRRTNVVGIFPNERAIRAWSGRCSSNATTNGRSPSVATSLRGRWPPSYGHRATTDTLSSSPALRAPSDREIIPAVR